VDTGFDPRSANRDGAQPSDARAAALVELGRMQSACELESGGGRVMAAVALWIVHSGAPTWLCAAFLSRYARVSGAHVPSWDATEAFGRPWPKGIKEKRLASIRARQALKAKLHRAAFLLMSEDTKRGVGKLLFNEVSALPGIGASASLVEKLYYEAISEGMLDLALWRAARLKGQQIVPANSLNS
jgi:hypothetical protein